MDKHDLTFLPYAEPDVLCALPRETVERRYGAKTAQMLEGDDPYWTDEIARWRHESESDKRLSFKRWVAEHRLGLAQGTDLVPELLSVVLPSDEPSPDFRSAIRALEDAVRGADIDDVWTTP